MRIRSLLVGVASVAVLSVAVAVPAVAAPARPANPCGFYKTSVTAFYNHCGPTQVRIHMDEYKGKTDNMCVQPGDHPIGEASAVENAYYIGAC
jgi:hypothetical protein